MKLPKYDLLEIMTVTVVVLFFLGVAAMFWLIGVGLWGHFNPPEKFDLVRSQWECTETTTRHTTQMILVGKTLVPTPHTTTECV